MSEIWAHYLEILTDPAHSLVEFTFVLIDVIIIDAVRRRLRRFTERRVRDEHKILDAEHGIEHTTTKIETEVA